MILNRYNIDNWLNELDTHLHKNNSDNFITKA